MEHAYRNHAYFKSNRSFTNKEGETIFERNFKFKIGQSITDETNFTTLKEVSFYMSPEQILDVCAYSGITIEEAYEMYAEQLKQDFIKFMYNNINGETYKNYPKM